MLTEELMKEVRRLEIRARRRVDDLFGGQYHSAFKGQGIEFAEVREYQPGDEVRAIDWNVTARTGHPFVKRFVEERQLTVILAVDCSITSTFGTVQRTKHTLAKETGAVMTLAASRNNDLVGVHLFGASGMGERESVHIPPSKGKLHTLRVIRALVDAEPGDRPSDLSAALSELGRTHKRRALIFILSDFLGGLNNTSEPDWARPIRMLARKHEVVALQITDPAEFSLPRAGIIPMLDPITGRRFSIDTGSRRVRKKYEQAAAAEDALIGGALRSAKVDRVQLSTGRSIGDDLARYFRFREQRA
ncbi:MAG: DUF58 domain-containing protein [Phycisphaerales bacterium]|nr:DUF58 domain-containing protein [Phycisphaerales bacterium]